MSAIIPGYEYDIFISYRQNDNHDGWVTRFVEALDKELKATLKNEVSIYFDENPHDGLLETHKVDASLAKKLKCLVFIPIVSQTYCDEKCFAWEHEFMPFIEMAKGDQLGIDITLSNGNVTSRVLPVKIHDIDTEDQNTLEVVLDGPLRSIDFIYKEVGVNRPLNTDDSEEKNLNKTRYKNQLNKVANSLKDIGTSILKQSDGEISLPTTNTERLPEIKSSKKSVYVGLSIVIIALLSFWGYRQFYSSPPAEVEDVTIAVLAFDDQSPNGDQEWLGDGMADEILNVLAKVKGLQVTGKTSSFSFKGKGLTTKVIGETLNVETVLEGSVSKIGDKLKITAQLIDVETEAHIWSKTYERDYTDIFEIQNEVAQSIAVSLRSELSLEELDYINTDYKVNPEAYEYYLRGENLHHDKYLATRKNQDFEVAEQFFIQAISIDSLYVEAYTGLANLYDTKSNRSPEFRPKADSVNNFAFSLDPNSAMVLFNKAQFALRHQMIDSGFYYYDRAILLKPKNNLGMLSQIAFSYYMIGLHDKAIKLSTKVLNSDPMNAFARVSLVSSLMKTGNIEEAKLHLVRILKFDKEHNSANFILFDITLRYDKDLSEAKKIYQKIKQLRPNRNRGQLAWLMAYEGNKEEALKTTPSPNFTLYSLLNMKQEALKLANSSSTNGNYTFRWTYNNLVNDVSFDFIRNTPEFRELLLRAKKVHEERVAKYGHLFDE